MARVIRYLERTTTGYISRHDNFHQTMRSGHSRWATRAIALYRIPLTDTVSAIVPNPDGSVDIYIQNTAPIGHESNWLPAPSGNFILWLRVYLPGQTVLNGEYKVPPIVQVS